MPVIPARFKKKYKSYYDADFYSETVLELQKLKFDGLWIYTWQGSEDELGAKDIWDSDEVKLKNYIQRAR